mmetsp:Transcript_57655/g.160698  ORF Transcript_57655/g.160698 Transcript_57655/m.160698 type:complete len:211 (+) Transcript_57655:57-689(+)
MAVGVADAKLALVAAAGNVARLEQLVLRDGVDVDARDEDGLTPLMAAARAGQLHVLQRLIEIGSPALNAVDRTGRTPLDYAVEAGHDEIVEYMTLDTSLLPFARGLLPAIARGDDAVVQELFSAVQSMRPSVNCRDERGAPALHCAVKAGKPEVVSMLLQQPGIKVNARDRYGRTAFDAAREKGLDELVHLLKGRGGCAGDDCGDDDDDP